MYCASCGAAIAPGLSYCNHCGARVTNSKRESKSSEIRPETLIGAIVCTFIFGTVAITMLLGVAKVMLGLEAGVVLAMGLICFLAMFMLEIVFVRLLLRGGRGAAEPTNSIQLAGPVTRELETATPRGLGEPVASVTEHTTRTFDPIYDRRTK